MRGEARQGVRLGAVLAAAVVVMLAFVSQAPAVTISAEVERNVFAGGPFSQAAGTVAEFSNPGAPNVTAHNVYSDRDGPDGEPLFFTPLVVSPGISRPVRGTEYLPQGSYAFNCTLHTGMRGVLEITAGTAVPRPRVTPSIRSSSLNTVRRKKKIDLGLKVSQATGRVAVKVAVKGKVVATAESGPLAAGTVRNLSARLTSKGRKAISKGSSVKFQVTAAAEFGTPKTISRVLRFGR